MLRCESCKPRLNLVGLHLFFNALVNCRETLRDVLQIIRNTGNPQVEYIIRTMKKWAKENRIPVS